MNNPQIVSLRASSDNYIHIIRDQETAIVVDPAAAAPVLSYLDAESLDLSHILITHHHSDHTGGCRELKKATGCTIIGPDDERIPAIDSSDTSSLSVSATLIDTPGHTSKHACFYLPDLKALFSGDTLFLGGCGRILEGTAKQMWQSLLKLRRLPEDTEVYPGHDYTLDNLEFCRSVLPGHLAIADRIESILSSSVPDHAPLSDESLTNVFLMCDDPEFTAETGLEGYPADIFAELRKRKDSW